MAIREQPMLDRVQAAMKRMLISAFLVILIGLTTCATPSPTGAMPIQPAPDSDPANLPLAEMPNPAYSTGQEFKSGIRTSMDGSGRIWAFMTQAWMASNVSATMADKDCK